MKRIDKTMKSIANAKEKETKKKMMKENKPRDITDSY